MENFLKILLGDMDAWTFIGYYLIACLSALLMLALRADRKRKHTVNTPIEFKWRFFFHDNILKFVVNLLTIGFAIRFSNEVIGSEVTGWVSFGIGIGLNEIIVRLETLQSKARD